MRKNALALALFLEIIAVALTVWANKQKRIFVFNSFSRIISKTYTFSFNIRNYFYLRQENQKLVNSNQQLLTQIINCKKLNDTVYDLVYAKVVKNSIGHTNNLMIISAGRKQGVRQEDGVISVTGNIVGTVISVGENYSSVLSILNKITSVSVLHKPTNTMGTLSWDQANSPRYMTLSGIPTYVRIKVGDTIITSGYSMIFPPDLVVGTIESFYIPKKSNTYEIRVKLAEDFSRLRQVFVIKNRDKQQINQVLKQAQKILSIE